MNNYIFYDIEIFSHDAIVVFKDQEKRLLNVFHNDFTELYDFIKGYTLVGFNNYHYDDIILSYMLQLRTPEQLKQVNDAIISGEKVYKSSEFSFDSLDVYQQIDTSRPSLKKIEGNMGRKIVESSVPFSIKTALTKEQYIETVNYCSYDVDTTIDIFHMRYTSYFQPKFSMLDMLGRKDAIKWNTTTISANLLLDKPLRQWDNIKVNETFMNLIPDDVKNMWLYKADEISEKALSNEGKKLPKHTTIENFDCIFQFGYGGLHGVHKTIKRVRNVKLLDVTSMYPNIVILLNVLGNSTDKYKALLDERVRVKHTDEILSDALKLILNSVYGNLNNEFSLLYNPNALLSVCVYGQIALYELCKRLQNYVTLININTDGIVFIPHSDEYIDAYQEWENIFSLRLEQKEYDLFLQRDVNNYIAVKGDKITCKGGDVNRYEKDAFFKNNNARILDLALVNALVYEKDILTTILENMNNPHLFQYILRAGSTFKATTDQNGQEYNKVNRIFAAKTGDFCLFKQRADNGLVRFPDTPTSMFLWNNDCSDLKDFSSIVDINHYYTIATKRLERWK